jgi:uncharacterized spore protein YtfJ
MLSIQELEIKFGQLVQQWIPVRDATIEEIKKTIDRLREHHKNVNISRITGSSAYVAGSLMAILGIGLAPVTLGASIGLSVSGIALAVAGGGTAAGASLTEAIIQKLNIDYVQAQLDHDDQLYGTISGTVQAIKKDIDGASKKCPGISTAEFAAVFEEVVLQNIPRTSNVGVRIAELRAYEKGAVALNVGSAAAKGIIAAGTVLNATLLHIDIAEIIRSSFSLALGSQTTAIKKLTDILQQLKEQKAAIDDLYV